MVNTDQGFMQMGLIRASSNAVPLKSMAGLDCSAEEMVMH